MVASSGDSRASYDLTWLPRLANQGSARPHYMAPSPRQPRLSSSALPLATATVGPTPGPLDREVDQPVEELGVGQTRDLPQSWVHRDRREPRDRVDLVDHEPVGAQKEVDPG